MNRTVQTVLMVTYYPILLGFVLGLFHYRRRWRETAFLFLLIFYYSGIHAVMLVTPRYRIPLLPIMIMFAVAFAIQCLERSAKRGSA